MTIFSPHEGHSMAVPAPDASTDSSWSQWLQLNMTSITAQLLLSLVDFDAVHDFKPRFPGMPAKKID